MRPASKCRFGGNCQTIGPSLSPSASGPEAKKLPSGASTSFSRLMWVMNCGPFIEKAKSGADSSRHLMKLFGA